VPRERILIADDEPYVLELCQRILAADGYEVESASDGWMAIEKAKERHFDLLLVDIKMPGLSGLETAQSVKEFDPEVVCVTMTGHGNMDTVIQALKLGIDEFVVKPFTPDELSIAISRGLEKERLRRENIRLKALIPLFELSKVFMSTVDLDELLHKVVQVACQETRSDWVVLLLWDAQRRVLLTRALVGFPSGGISLGETEEGAEIAASVMRSGDQLVLQDRSGPFAVFMEKIEVHSLVVSPLLVKKKAIGVLVLAKVAQGDLFAPGDVELLLVLSGQAAIAIENASLFEEIQHAYQGLQKLDHMKSEFINIAAHELRTPLGILLGYATILQERAEGEDREQLEIIVRNAMRLRSLIDDMLSLSYLEMGKPQIKLEQIILRHIIDEAVRDLSPLAEGKGQSIEIKLPDDLPPIAADRQKLGLILANLLSNAIKFTPEGGRITIEAESNEPEIWVSVSDTGIGIPPEEHGMIFERFYQVEDSLTRKQGGIGLGLAIAKGIVELCGGRIWVESGVGRGSTFTFTILQQGGIGESQITDHASRMANEGR
jgi:signal transduction histidine kinase/ActR/RegA family two-component response regulator